MRKIIFAICCAVIVLLTGCAPNNTPEYLIKFNIGCSGFVLDEYTIMTAAHCRGIYQGTTIHNQIFTLEKVYVDYYNDIAIYHTDEQVKLNIYAEFYNGKSELGTYYGGCNLYFSTTGRKALLGKNKVVVYYSSSDILIYSGRIYSVSYAPDRYIQVFCSGDSGGFLVIEDKIVAMGSGIYDTRHMGYYENIFMFVIPAKTLNDAYIQYKTGNIGI